MTTLEETMNLKTLPLHYIGNGKITCKDAMDSMMFGLHYKGAITYWWGCVLKYIWRWPYKGVREDLEKAKACIDYLLESLPGGDDS